MTTDPFAGEELTDGDLQGEIELVGDLVVAASDSDDHLSQERIDEVLGVFDSPSAEGSADCTEVSATPRVEAPEATRASSPEAAPMEPRVEPAHGRPRRHPATTTG